MVRHWCDERCQRWCETQKTTTLQHRFTSQFDRNPLAFACLCILVWSCVEPSPPYKLLDLGAWSCCSGSRRCVKKGRATELTSYPVLSIHKCPQISKNIHGWFWTELKNAIAVNHPIQLNERVLSRLLWSPKAIQCMRTLSVASARWCQAAPGIDSHGSSMDHL